MKICHLTSAHPRTDTRIFLKMARSMTARGHDVTLIVADSLGNDNVDGVKILDAGVKNNRLMRIIQSPKAVSELALKNDYDIYHLHDPELLTQIRKLQRSKKKIIFDAHEDFPKQLLSKPYLNKHILGALSKAANMFELTVLPKLSALIGATPFITEKLRKSHSIVANINNYPMEQELQAPTDQHTVRDKVIYLGSISEIRGIRELVEAIGLTSTKTQLHLCGEFSQVSLAEELREMDAWKLVHEHGKVSRSRATELMAESLAGIVTFHPVPNHIDAQPNKLFEYMSAGLAVIGSDFPLWREILSREKCGLLVDPKKPTSIAHAIDMLSADSDSAQKMGKNGIAAVKEHYNWETEADKLEIFYKNLLRKDDQ